MTNKKVPDINIVDLSKKREQKEQEENKIPDVIIEKLERIVSKAKEGKLQSIVVNFDYEIEDSEKDDGNTGSMYYNKNQSPLEILGTIEIMKNQVFHMIFSSSKE